MEGISLGRCKDYITGELKEYNWKGSVTLLRPSSYSTCEDTLFASVSNPEEMYQWQGGSYLDEEILISGKCLISW